MRLIEIAVYTINEMNDVQRQAAYEHYLETDYATSYDSYDYFIENARRSGCEFTEDGVMLK